MTTRVVDENLAHQLCGNREKMRPALEQRCVEPDQANERLIDERSALQRVIRPFVPQVRVGDAAQFFVDKRQKSIERLAVAASPFLQEQRNAVGRRMLHGIPPKCGALA